MKVFAVVLLLTLCAACVSAPDGEADALYLPRIVALDDDDHYPAPLHYGGESPENLQEAVAVLLRSLKLTPRPVQASDACGFADIDDLDLRYGSCVEVAC